MNAEIRPRTILTVMLFVIGVLLFANAITFGILIYTEHDVAWGLINLFNFDREHSVPAFYSALMLLLSAVCLYVIARRHRRMGQPAMAWFVLAAIFVFLSVDEVAAIHERLTGPMRESFDATGLLYFAWIIPYGAVVLLLGALFIPFLVRLPRRTMWLFVAAGTLFVGGAIGLEMLGGRHDELWGMRTLGYAVIATSEELMEKLGVALFIYAMLDYMVRQFGVIRISIDTVEPVVSASAVNRQVARAAVREPAGAPAAAHFSG